MSKQTKMYFLNFIGEFWNVKPKYRNWCFGRVEIFKRKVKWPINELRFSTPWTEEWEKFRDEWDFKELDDLTEFEKLLTLNYETRIRASMVV